MRIYAWTIPIFAMICCHLADRSLHSAYSTGGCTLPTNLRASCKLRELSEKWIQNSDSRASQPESFGLMVFIGTGTLSGRPHGLLPPCPPPSHPVHTMN